MRERKPINPCAGISHSMCIRSPAHVHGLHFRAARADQFHCRAHFVIGDVQRESLDRFAGHAVNDFFDDFGLAHGKFVALAPHIFQQHAQVQQAAAGNVELFRRIAGRYFNATLDCIGSRSKRSRDLARGDVFAFPADEKANR